MSLQIKPYLSKSFPTRNVHVTLPGMAQASVWAPTLWTTVASAAWTLGPNALTPDPSYKLGSVDLSRKGNGLCY